MAPRPLRSFAEFKGANCQPVAPFVFITVFWLEAAVWAPPGPMPASSATPGLALYAPPGPMPASSASSTPSTPGPMPAPSGVMAKHQTGAYPAKSVSVLPFKRQNVSPSERWELDRKNPKRETTT